MSSTNRSNAREKHISDYYVTPVDKIYDFLVEFKKYEPNAFDGIILDPCAGGDVEHPMSYPEALKKIGVDDKQIKTMDVREDSLADHKGDYLKVNLKKKPKVIITNPPFSLAQEIIEKALDDVDENGYVIMLLRLNFLGGKKRKVELWDVQLPKYIFVHHRRMSFTDDGKTDSIEYAHFVWQKDYGNDFAKIKVI